MTDRRPPLSGSGDLAGSRSERLQGLQHVGAIAQRIVNKLAVKPEIAAATLVNELDRLFGNQRS
jgi:hypothetical protein